MSYKSPTFTEDQLEVMKATGRLPLLLTTRQAAAVLGIKPHDMGAFAPAAGLIPLAFPLTEADGYFLAEDVLSVSKSAAVKGRRAMKLKWENGNNRDSTDACSAHGGTELQRASISALVKQVEDKVLETYLRAEQVFQRSFELPEIDWGQRGTCAGRASWRQNQISLNSVLLIENRDEFIREIVPHEVAHLINRALHGPMVKPHGSEWRSVMVALGQTPNRCHNFDVSNARVRTERRHTCRCKCTSHSVSQRVINRILRGAIYKCCHCGSAIEPVDSQS